MNCVPHILDGTGERMSEDNVTIADAEKRKVPCLVYSRVVGYLTPVQNWNIAKQQEFKERKVFKQPEAEGEA